ncbi:MAG: hypothetical protein CMG93_03745 [Marinomonas sp.]|uniref:zinc-binding metallopeptidase family protein n=1 Tax=Marinomonas communis TaxID=28254 RepID=UPI000C6B5CA0|nr:putative zinc-binding metallopeptidase [Marinomonas communis]MAF15075.1 hypothetical protein [Marinomonas sp.]MCC4275869.1 putative zinc-binding peptidase [Marinomonas communis]
MKLFSCQQCGQALLFENTQCESCQSPLGFHSDTLELTALTPLEQGFNVYSNQQPSPDNKVWFHCSNHAHNVCNWLVSTPDTLCDACDLNRHIPNLSGIEEQQAWQTLEQAKHQLVYALRRLNLPIVNKKQDPDDGLSFDFISEENVIPDGAQTSTGHAQGQVTINAVEADSVDREQMRKDMNESYRTVIGHFRHEIGHYYWDQLIADQPTYLASFRALFGDEQRNYAEALSSHYATPNLEWQNEFISSYASSHPWEDWAETWAHYLHILDTLETAYYFGLSTRPPLPQHSQLTASASLDPYTHESFEDLLNEYLPLTFAANCLNRSMGQPDLYPFVLVPKVREKLGFIHQLLRQIQANTHQ